MSLRDCLWLQESGALGPTKEQLAARIAAAVKALAEKRGGALTEKKED